MFVKSKNTDRTAASIESYSFDYVPETERTGSISVQFRFWFMVNATLLTAFTGAIGPQLGLGLPATLLAVVIGSIFGTMFQAFHGAQGPHMGLPQMIQSRVQFGSRGAVVPIGAASVIFLGFSMFYVQAGASAFVDVSGISLTPTQIVVGVAAMLLAIIGYRIIIRIEGIVAYVMAANLLLLSVAAAFILPWGELWSNTNFTIVGFLAQFGASAAYQLAIAPMVSDYTRYLPAKISGAKVSLSVFSGTIISAIWISGLGSAVTSAYPKLDVISGIRELGDTFGFSLGSVTLLVSMFSCLITATLSLYSGSISLLSALEAFRPLKSGVVLRIWTLSIAGIVTLLIGLMLPSDLLETFAVYLTMLGYLLIPWTAVNLVDYYIVRRGRYSITDIMKPSGGIYGLWSWRGLVSWSLGLLAMIPFFSASLYTGPIASALGGADISFAIGLAVSVTVYLITTRSVNLKAEMIEVGRAKLSTNSLAHNQHI
jgi:NCS1 family nucleobase:cation symporter-1